MRTLFSANPLSPFYLATHGDFDGATLVGKFDWALFWLQWILGVSFLFIATYPVFRLINIGLNVGNSESDYVR